MQSPNKYLLNERMKELAEDEVYLNVWNGLEPSDCGYRKANLEKWPTVLDIPREWGPCPSD